MVFAKSLLAGAAALTVYLLIGGVIVLKLLTPLKMPVIPADGSGFVGNSNWISIPILPVLIGALLVFSGAFYWTFKRCS
jgi:hypothetical protein